MSPNERRLKILHIIEADQKASVDYLAKMCCASSETIRRDLSFLSEQGKVQRNHGGAQLPRLNVEAPFQYRIKEHAEEKRRIAKKAASLLSPGDSLFIDTGSTTIYFAEAIAEHSDLIVVTNSYDVAKTIKQGSGHSRVFLLGGEFNINNNQTDGSIAISQISQFTMKYAFITVGGVDSKIGITDFSFEESQIAAAMISQADETVVLADASKLNRTTTYKVCELKSLSTLITNDGSPPILVDALKKNAVNLMIT